MVSRVFLSLIGWTYSIGSLLSLCVIMIRGGCSVTFRGVRITPKRRKSLEAFDSRRSRDR